MATITVIRLKSDNFDCYVTEKAYREILLQMSTGDFGSHKFRKVELSPESYDKLVWHSGKGVVDYDDGSEHGNTECENMWLYYDGKGDCTFETAS